MTAWLFPGQGSQYKGMGEELFQKFAPILQQTDELLGYSIQSLCLEDPDKRLNQTQFTQPALYTVNALYTLQQRMDGAMEPRFVAGHSLGEYNALFAAGVVDFTTGLQLVKKRGELMGKVKGSGMAAVMSSGDVVQSLLQEYQLFDLDIANYNSPKQTVIAGTNSSLERAKEIFAEKKIIVIQLNVSAAFHSRHMVNIGDEFEEFLQDFDFAKPQIPIIANATARPYKSAHIINNLTRQISGSVRWVDTVRHLIKEGVNNFIEVGPKNVLTRLVHDIRSQTLQL